MMNNKETEKYIEDTLNSEKPSKRVLMAAKNIMLDKKQQPNKKTWRYYAVAASSACLFIFGIIAAIFSGQDLYSENHTNNALEQTPAAFTKYWFIAAIVSISIAIIIGAITIILRIKNSKRKK